MMYYVAVFWNPSKQRIGVILSFRRAEILLSGMSSMRGYHKCWQSAASAATSLDADVICVSPVGGRCIWLVGDNIGVSGLSLTMPLCLAGW